MVQFYDSSDVANIPLEADHAALYGDGAYQVSGTQIPPHITYRRWITVLGLNTCGIADFEPGNAVFEDKQALRQWAAEHHAIDQGIPIVYTDRENAAAAVQRCTGLLVYYWISTLDNRDWTPAGLSLNMAQGDGGRVPPAKIAPNRIWANQNVTVPGKYDRSNLFLGWWA